MIFILLNDRGYITEALPSINKILKMLLPIISPSAIWDFPFSADIMQVHASGSDVPIANTVIAMNLSDTPIYLAISTPDLTNNLPPNIRATRPPIIKIIDNQREYTFVFSESFVVSFPFNNKKIYTPNTRIKNSPSHLVSVNLPMTQKDSKSNSVATVRQEMSNLLFLSVTVIGTRSDVSPNMNAVLKMLLPMMFPIAMSGLWDKAPVILTTSSGQDVPNPMIKAPIINSDIPHLFATDAPPSIR